MIWVSSAYGLIFIPVEKEIVIGNVQFGKYSLKKKQELYPVHLQKFACKRRHTCFIHMQYFS